MKLSVVIPCYNAAEFLPRAIASVKKQGIEDAEVIVVDDASTDATVAVAEQLRAEVPNLRIIVQPANGGPAKARNAGLKAVRGQYVCFLDADDAYGENVFATVLPVLDQTPWIQAIDFPVRLVDSHREVTQRHLNILANSVPSNLIVRRELAQAIGGFPESNAFRAKQAGEDIAFRRMVRRWGNVFRKTDVYLDYTVRRGGHFDFFMDRLTLEDGKLSLRPDEGDLAVKEAMSEFAQQTTERMRHHVGIERTRAAKISVNDRDLDFETFDNDWSLGHATQTLRGKTYPPIPFLSTATNILDIGANIGASAVTFALRYPNARVVALEPSRQAFVLLRCNTSNFPKVECHNIGLFDRTMTRSLFLGGPDSVTNSIVKNALTRAAHEEIQLVAAGPFTTQIGMSRPDIIKIDTEGCELPIVSSMVESFRAAKAVYLEYHSEEDRQAIDKLLAKTHILFYAKVPFPHRGELVYVRNDAFRTQKDRDRWRIGDAAVG